MYGLKSLYYKFSQTFEIHQFPSINDKSHNVSEVHLTNAIAKSLMHEVLGPSALLKQFSLNGADFITVESSRNPLKLL